MNEKTPQMKLEENELEFFALHRSERKVAREYVALRSAIKEVPLWNFAGKIACPSGQTERIVAEVEGFFREQSVAPAFRITPWTEPQAFETLLTERGYVPVLRISSMLFDEATASKSASVITEVTRAVTQDELSIFTDIQLRGFSTTMDWKPWYLETNNTNALRADHRYYIGWHRGKPVGVCLALNYPADVVGIYGVTTLAEYRGQGIARALLQQVVADAQQSGVQWVTLATELDGPAEAVFGRFGFKRLFSSIIYQARSSKGGSS